jgi:hypothetical protein
MSQTPDRRAFLKQASLLAAAPFARAPAGCSSSASRSAASRETVTETTTGRVRGYVVDGINASWIAWRHVGEEPFHAAHDGGAVDRVRDAVQWGRVAPQSTAPDTSEYTSMVRWTGLPGGIGED